MAIKSNINGDTFDDMLKAELLKKFQQFKNSGHSIYSTIGDSSSTENDLGTGLTSIYDKYQVSVRLTEKDVMEVIGAALRGTRELSKVSILKYYVSVVEMVTGLSSVLEKKDRKKYAGATKKLKDCAELALYEIGIAEKPDEYTWKRKDGVSIKLIEMDDSYLLNAIKYMKNKAIEGVLLEGKYPSLEDAMSHLGKRYRWLIFETMRRGIFDKTEETDDTRTKSNPQIDKPYDE